MKGILNAIEGDLVYINGMAYNLGNAGKFRQYLRVNTEVSYSVVKGSENPQGPVFGVLSFCGKPKDSGNGGNPGYGQQNGGYNQGGQKPAYQQHVPQGYPNLNQNTAAPMSQSTQESVYKELSEYTPADLAASVTDNNAYWKAKFIFDLKIHDSIKLSQALLNAVATVNASPLLKSCKTEADVNALVERTANQYLSYLKTGAMTVEAPEEGATTTAAPQQEQHGKANTAAPGPASKATA